jgi:glucose 1-dehydrogenase
MRFTGKVCVVSGGGSGIGKAACKKFASEGAKVLVVDLNQQHGDETVQEIIQEKGEALFAKCDVGEIDQVKAAVQMAVDKWGKIDVVVNDAAMMTFSPIVDLPDDDFDKVLNVNLRSFPFLQVLCPAYAARRRDREYQLRACPRNDQERGPVRGFKGRNRGIHARL